MCPAKTQIRLGISPVWTESLLTTWRIYLVPFATHSEYIAKTLIWLGWKLHWSESSTGAQLIFLVLWCIGSHKESRAYKVSHKHDVVNPLAVSYYIIRSDRLYHQSSELRSNHRTSIINFSVTSSHFCDKVGTADLMYKVLSWQFWSC